MPPSSPPILSWRSPVCDKKKAGGYRHLPGTSVVQWALSSVRPAFAPVLPQGIAGRSKAGSQPQGQLGGWCLADGRKNRKGVCIRKQRLLLSGQAQPTCRDTASWEWASQEMGWGAIGFSGFSVQLPLDGSQWERACRVLSLHCVECVICQEPMKLGERRPLFGLPAPTPEHQLIQGLRAGGWPGQVYLRGKEM